MKSFKEIKALPPYLQPKILSAVAFINSAAPNIEKAVEEDYSVVVWPKYVKEKDINDMIMGGRTNLEISDIIHRNTFSGLEAKTQLSNWKKV